MISIIICSTNNARFDAVSKNYAALLVGEPYEIIRVVNARSLCDGYTRGLARSRGELLVFSHDDIEIHNADFALRLRQHLKQFDLVGIAGTTRVIGGRWLDAGPSFVYGQVVQVHPQNGFVVHILGVPRRAVGGIQAVDGVFFAAQRQVFDKVAFDAQTFDGFHHYDMDFSFAAYLAGFRLAVATDIHLLHESWGPHDQSWQLYADRFLAKYARHLHAMAPAAYTTARVHVATKEDAWQIMQRNVDVLEEPRTK